MAQEKENYCLCAILQEIFRDYQINMSQDEIASKLHPTKEGFKAKGKEIKNFLEENKFNYSFYWWNETPFNEPDSLLLEISENEGFIGVNHHIYRVLNFKDPLIKIIDPGNDAIKYFNYCEILKEMSEKSGGFGLIKKLK